MMYTTEPTEVGTLLEYLVRLDYIMGSYKQKLQHILILGDSLAKKGSDQGSD